MTWTLRWPADAVMPAAERHRQAMGLPRGLPPSARTAGLVAEARDMLLRLAEPRACVAPIDRAAFARVHAGQGRNDPQTPLARIVAHADALALFVATLGAPLTNAIGDLFARDHPALGYVLDTLASETADGLAYRVAGEVASRAAASGSTGPDAKALPYSPGYCGWHVSGQRALFDALGAEAHVGVTLNDSFLMQPLKSVSGVVVVAAPEVHDAGMDYECCESCQTRECQDRLFALRRGDRG
jgi:hypothetical protein